MHGMGGSRTRSHTFRCSPWSFFTSFQAHSIVWRIQVHILHLCWNWIYPIWDWASQLWLLGWSECKILTSGWSVRNLDIIVCLPNLDHHLLRPIFYRLQNLSFSFACTATSTASNLVSVPKPIVGLQQVTWLAVLWKQKLWMNTKPLESLLTVPHLCLHCRQIDSGALNHQCADSRTSVGTFAYFALLCICNYLYLSNFTFVTTEVGVQGARQTVRNLISDHVLAVAVLLVQWRCVSVSLQ